MKKRLVPAISIGIAVILIGSLVYAADKRKAPKAADRNADKIHEEEALTAELLNAVEEKAQKLHGTGEPEKFDADRPNQKKGQLASTR